MGWTGNDGKTYSSSTEASEKGGGVSYHSSSSSNSDMARGTQRAIEIESNIRKSDEQNFNILTDYYNAGDWDAVIIFCDKVKYLGIYYH